MTNTTNTTNTVTDISYLVLDLPDPAVSDRDAELRTPAGDIVPEWSYDDHMFLEALGMRWKLDGELVQGGLNYFYPCS
jgi:hypothetical protein